MRTAAVAFLLSLVTAAVLTPLARRLARHVGGVDLAGSSRKIHTQPIPRLGGIAIVCAFYAPLVALYFVDSGVGQSFVHNPRAALGMFAGGAAIAVLGMYDDLRGAGARKKFAVQFAVGAFLYVLGFRIDAIANPFGAPIALGPFGLPFTMLWIAGVINALNLIDGLDGLAGGVALIKISITAIFALLHRDPLLLLFAAALGGATLGFLRYNFNPATIFMGDTGSMFLGFVLAASAIQTHQISSTAVAILVPAVALGVPIADTVLAMARRAIRGAPLFQADREHIHHRLLRLGFTHRETVLILYGAAVVCGGAALALAYASSTHAVALLLALSLGVVLVLRRLGYLRLDCVRAVLAERRRNLALRGRVREVGERLKRAAELNEVWESVRALAAAVGARCVGLRLLEKVADGSTHVTQFSQGFDDVGPGVFRTRHSVVGERREGGTVELGWTDGRRELERDTEIAVELACEHVLAALNRIEVTRGAGATGATNAHSRADAALAAASRAELRGEPRAGKVANLRH